MTTPRWQTTPAARIASRSRRSLLPCSRRRRCRVRSVTGSSDMQRSLRERSGIGRWGEYQCRSAKMVFMFVGFGAPVAGAWATPGHLGSFAAKAERAGYASLWTFQRLLVPEALPMEPVYQSVLDLMVALGFVAARTERIRLCVAVLNLPFASPALVAKQAATVDVLSGGRLELGLGIGWMPQEFELTGAVMARRGARTEEYLAVL